jgi:hypothetical protein
VIRPAACTAAAGLCSQGSGRGKRDIDGRRSATMTTRGASSAKYSRTTNSSAPCADERRAEAFQSIA